MKRRKPGSEAASRERASGDAGGSLQEISLPKSTKGRGTSVFAALKARRTTRAMSGKKLSQQVLSNLLWAACGVNRKEGPFGIPGRTAGSASNSQEIDIYVLMEEGAYLYDAVPHCLVPVAEGDMRALAIGKGQGKAGAEAPVRLVYVVDIERFGTAGYQEPGLHDPETQKAYSSIDTGLIAANVYLFAASQGLGTWFHNCNKAELSVKLALRKNQRALFGQTVGYPE